MSEHRIVGSEEWLADRERKAAAADRRFALGKEIAWAFANEENYFLTAPENRRLDKPNPGGTGLIETGGALSPSFVNAVDMAEVLMSITDEQLEAFWCYHNKGMTHARIAERMERSEDAVRKLIGRAIQRMTVRIRNGVEREG